MGAADGEDEADCGETHRKGLARIATRSVAGAARRHKGDRG
jgi:hypothetical protein